MIVYLCNDFHRNKFADLKSVLQGVEERGLDLPEPGSIAGIPTSFSLLLP